MMKYSVKTLIGIALICLFSTSANAIKPIYSGGKERAALRGYDVVAYFTENAPVKGSAEFTTEHKGAKWLFANEANLALFVENPEKYEPAYGGYCAYAVSNGSSASSKPEYFTIVDGKLYLNYSKGVFKKWQKDIDRYIEEGDAEWPALLAR